MEHSITLGNVKIRQAKIENSTPLSPHFFSRGHPQASTGATGARTRERNEDEAKGLPPWNNNEKKKML